MERVKTYQEPKHTIYCGHALDILQGMSAESVDMVITSPPYWGLRTYKTEPIIWGENHCEHEWGKEIIRRDRGKTEDSPDVRQPRAMIGTETRQGNFCLKCNAWRGELGLEPTIELYIQHLILIFNEVKRVLKKTGTCWVNIDDSYSATRWSNTPSTSFNPKCADVVLQKHTSLPDKCLCLIPQRFVLAMVQEGWLLRNDIVWNKPNPMPESVKDRFTGSWEHLFFFVKSKHYFFEQQFEPLQQSSVERIEYPWHLNKEHPVYPQVGDFDERMGERFANPLGRNKRDVWEINTQPYPEAHFATFPEKLCETPILAGCPSMICKKCGKAREKVYEKTGHINKREAAHQPGNTPTKVDSTGWALTERPTNEYTDCGCGCYVCGTCGFVLESKVNDTKQKAISREAMPNLREAIQGEENNPNLLTDLRGEVGSKGRQTEVIPEGRTFAKLQGREDQQGWLSSDICERQVSHGTSSFDGSISRQGITAERGSASQERIEGRQSPRKLRDCSEKDAQQPCNLSLLPETIQGQVDCPHCHLPMTFQRYGFEPGVVLDPFTGSGTAQAVAKKLGRKSIGIDLNPSYCKLAAKRLQEIPLPMDFSGDGHG